MKKKSIILIGAGGHAKVIFSALMRLQEWNVIGYTDIERRDMYSLKYLGTDEELKDIIKEVKNAVVGVGQIKKYDKRSNMYRKLKELGFSLPPIVAQSAVVMKNVTIGEGTFIGENAYVGPDVQVGVMNIINTGAVVEHESRVGDFVHISVSATLAGNTEIGSGTFIGMGANILNGVTIGENVIVAAGTVVRKPVKRNSLVYSGKIVKKRYL